MRQIQHCGVPMWVSDANMKRAFTYEEHDDDKCPKELKEKAMRDNALTKLYADKLVVENDGLPATFKADLLAIDDELDVIVLSTAIHLPCICLIDGTINFNCEKYYKPVSKDDLDSGEFFKENPELLAVVSIYT